MRQCKIDECKDCQKTAMPASQTLNDLLCGLNGNNKRCIVVKCKYEVYDDEWSGLCEAINNAIAEYDNGNFKAVNAAIEDAE